MGLLIFTYNFLMLVGLSLLLPIWLPLMAHREKHRSTFFKRLFMESIDGDENRASIDEGAAVSSEFVPAGSDLPPKLLLLAGRLADTND